MATYRSKSTPIDAIRIPEIHEAEAWGAFGVWMNARYDPAKWCVADDEDGIHVTSPSGSVVVPCGHYLIKNLLGEISWFPPDAFAANFELAT